MNVKWEMLFENDPMLSNSDSMYSTLLDEDGRQQFDFVDPGDIDVKDETLFTDLLPLASTSYTTCNTYAAFSEDPKDFLGFVEQPEEETPAEVAETVVVPVPAEEKAPPVRVLRSPKSKREPSPESETSAIFGNGKPKLYSVRPFKNPQRERARQNAINAKMNREKKKREAERLHADTKALRDQNLDLKKSLRRVEARALRAERELNAIRELLVTHNVADLLKMASDGDETTGDH